jgi:hypothetical protein
MFPQTIGDFFIHMKHKTEKEIIGRLEYIAIPDFKLTNVEAKIDTGAYNGAIHVSLVNEFEKEGKRWIRFVILDDAHPEFFNKVYETDEFVERRVRSSNGELQHRYAVTVTLILKGKEIKTTLGLSNRKDLRYPILIGRKIIKKYFIVDPSKTFTDNK